VTAISIGILYTSFCYFIDVIKKEEKKKEKEENSEKNFAISCSVKLSPIVNNKINLVPNKENSSNI
jgi:hypothetical protein